MPERQHLLQFFHYKFDDMINPTHMIYLSIWRGAFSLAKGRAGVMACTSSLAGKLTFLRPQLPHYMLQYISFPIRCFKMFHTNADISPSSVSLRFLGCASSIHLLSAEATTKNYAETSEESWNGDILLLWCKRKDDHWSLTKNSSPCLYDWSARYVAFTHTVLNNSELIIAEDFREDINWKKTFSFGHCPNYLTPPPHDPNSGNLVLFFRKSKFKIWKSV